MLPELEGAPPVPKPAPSSAPKTPPSAPSSSSATSSGSGTAPSSGPTAPAAGGTPKPKMPFGPDMAADLGMLTGATTTIPGLTDTATSTANASDAFSGMFGGGKPEPEKEKQAPVLQAGGFSNVSVNGVPMPMPQLAQEPDFIAERQEREASLKGRGRQMKSKKIEPLTWDEYEKLDPTQRSAIDFNTALTQAVNRDRKNQDEYNPNDTQSEVYNAAVTDMFGTDGGSKLYAPETLAVLRQLNWKDQAGDLDDFLKLKVAFTAKDVKELQATEAAPDLFGVPGTKPVDTLSKIQEGLAEHQEDMAHALITSDNLLQSVGVMARASRQQDLGYLGGVVKPLKTTLGYGSTADDEEFRKAFDILATKTNADSPEKMNEILGKMKATTSPEMWAQFMSYLQSRSFNTESYSLGFATGGVDNSAYHTPEEFRQLLGLEPPASGQINREKVQ